MKRFITFLFIFVLIFSFSFSAFALEDWEGAKAPDTDAPNWFILYNVTYGDYEYLKMVVTGYFTKATILDNGISFSGLADGGINEAPQLWYYVPETSLTGHYELIGSAPSRSGMPVANSSIIIVGDGNVSIVDNRTSVEPSTECDGSSCPANDADHNNVCDDCGKMLAMSLRTTLLDYAIIHAREGNSYYGFDYFAIFYPSNEAEWDSKFVVYLSNTPFVPVANGYVGEDIKTCEVQRMNTGEIGATGWSSVTSVPLLELAYAEPEINFPLPPLEETVQEVTEGALMEEITTLAQTVRIILIIAVSCLALWVLLEIFFKVLRIFQVR